jgi:hypothetical protein
MSPNAIIINFFRNDHLYSQTITLYKIGRSPQVVHCAPKLGLEGRRLWPKVLSTCHDGARLQNVLQMAVGWSWQQYHEYLKYFTGHRIQYLSNQEQE